MHITPSEILLLVKLFLAHILTDFIFQTKKSLERKEQGTIWLVWHGVITAAVATLLFYTSGYEGGKIFLFLWVLCTHTVIDWVKIYTLKKDALPKQKLYWFLYDQLAHLVAILIFWIFFFHKVDKIGEWFMHTANSSYVLAYATGYIFLTYPTAILMRELLQVFDFKPKQQENTEDKGLANAGKAIGILERIIIFTLVIVNQYTAIGFLVAAKSILRIKGDGNEGELKTEYIIVGTFLSFGIAIIVGELAKLIA